MTYSSQKEVSTLKRKLDQVAQCGCKAFALLFDDIEPDMSPADKEVFQSFAHAQVIKKIYEILIINYVLRILFICRFQLQMKSSNTWVNPNF